MPEPTNPEEALSDIVAHVNAAAQAHTPSRTLDPACLAAFRDGDTFRKGNLVRFQMLFNDRWEADKETLRRTADFHGKVCSMIADFLDESANTTSNTIDLDTFRTAGKVARAVCPFGDPTNTLGSNSGGWCTWP